MINESIKKAEESIVRDAWTLLNKFACDNGLSIIEAVYKYKVTFGDQKIERLDNGYQWKFLLKIEPRKERLECDEKIVISEIHRQGDLILY